MFLYVIRYWKDSIGGGREEVECFSEDKKDCFLETLEKLKDDYNVHNIEIFHGLLKEMK